MPSKLITTVVPNFGANGINTRDPKFGLPITELLVGENIVVDESNRLAVRNGFLQENTVAGLAGLTCTRLHHHVKSDGNEVFAGVFSDNTIRVTWDYGVSWTTLAFPGGYTNPNTDKWELVSFNGNLIGFYKGDNPVSWAVAGAGVAPATELTALTGASVALAAFGRLWYAETSANKTVVYYSGVINVGIEDGTLDMYNYMKNSGAITALAAFQDTLLVFCENQLITVAGVTTGRKGDIVVREVLPGLGCLSRNAIASTGDDLVFLNNDGLHSIKRAIASGYQPTEQAVSDRVEIPFRRAVKAEGTDLAYVRMYYSKTLGLVLARLKADNKIWVFDPDYIDERGGWRTFTWITATQNNLPRDFAETLAGDLFGGGYQGLFEYTQYGDGVTGATERISAYATTGQVTFDDGAMINSLKKAFFSVYSGDTSICSFTWANELGEQETGVVDISGFSSVTEWGSTLAEYNDGPLDPFNSPVPLTEWGSASEGDLTATLNLSMNARWWTFQLNMQTTEDPLALQALTLHTMNHKRY